MRVGVRPRNASTGKVRIIGGVWRGTRLDVPDVPGLRPSPDRVRETLFNWLQGELAGRRCLDLFAGTGALGFEAASRGAAAVTMIERAPRAVDGLRATATRLQAAQVEIVAADALAWLARPPDRHFDLAFVDPPFASGLHQAALDALQPWLSEAALVHVEYGADRQEPMLRGFHARREGRTRETRFCLLQRD